MKKRALKIGTYGKTGREFYRLNQKAAAQHRAKWTIIVLIVFILGVVFIREVIK
jgi:hypothetical protein